MKAIPQITFEVELLKNGQVRFCRSDNATNEHMFLLLSELTTENHHEIQQFLDGANFLEHIVGDEPLCG